MPGHVKRGGTGEPDPDPTPFLFVSYDQKQKDLAKVRKTDLKNKLMPTSTYKKVMFFAAL